MVAPSTKSFIITIFFCACKLFNAFERIQARVISSKYALVAMRGELETFAEAIV